MFKYRLFAPGPTPVSEETSLAMAHPIIHHRTKAFEAILQEVRDGLRWLFQTKGEVLLFASSGTGAMEGSVTNLFSKGDKVIVVDGGKFGERWWKIAQAYGLETEILKVEWGEAVQPDEVRRRLERGGVKGVFVQASESSTGVYHPIEELAKITRATETLLVVDAISALGAVNLPFDGWGIDAMIGGSQKALGLPPGLAFVALSEKGWSAVEKSQTPRFYFDFKKERKSLVTNQSAYTPAIGIILGLADSLKKLREEGLENLFERHARMARAVRSAMKALGLKLYAERSPVNSLTAVVAPPGVDGQKIYRHLQEKYNMTIAGGQDAAKGKIFRIAHLGHYDPLDMITVIAAVEWTLADLGYKFELGCGVRAALEAFR